MIISLTGFMGCGKSSVGRRLSELLCCRFIDLDSVIEERTGRSIPEIFASDGEAAFRDIEKNTLKDVLLVTMDNCYAPLKTHLTPDTLVLSLGGGTVMTKECEDMVRESSTCVYLRASVETLIRNLQNETEGRPMLAASHDQESPAQDKESCLRARIEDLMIKRSATYESTAHIIIDTDGKTIDCIAEAILSEL